MEYRREQPPQVPSAHERARLDDERRAAFSAEEARTKQEIESMRREIAERMAEALLNGPRALADQAKRIGAAAALKPFLDRLDSLEDEMRGQG